MMIRADLERFDLGQSLLGSLGLDGAIRDVLRDALQSALDGDATSLGFPVTVKRLSPTFTSAHFSSDRGTPETVISATARLSASDATALFGDLLTERGR